MASLNVQTFTQIIAQQAAAIASATTKVTNFAVGSLTRAYIGATASVALWLQAENVTTLQATRLATSSGADVDSFIGDYGLTRLPAVSATGQVTFSRYSTTQSALLLPNTQVVTLDGSQSYIVPIDITNAAWNAAQGGFYIPSGVSSLTVGVVALTAGSAGNVLANTVGLIQSAAPFDTVTNNNPITSGADAETDAQSKAQFALYVQTRSLATVQALQYAALSVQGGLTAYVAENIDASGAYAPGSVVVTVDDGSGYPPSSLISSVYAACNLVRGAGTRLAVIPPIVIPANVSLTISVSTGYVKSQIQPLVAAALSQYISSLPVGASMPYSMIANIAYNSSPAVSNVTSITLNGGTSDIGGGPTNVVRDGALSIN